MRHHFHRCGHLRVLEIDASETNGARRGGAQILEELCEAKRLARCVGLAECDVLSPAQKRDLLTTRATRLREEEAGTSSLVDASDPRREELRALRSELEDEYREIVEDNRARRAEGAAAVQRNPRPIPAAQEWELAAAGVSFFEDDALRALRTARLDAIERRLDALRRGRAADCARCRGAIELERLRQAPDTSVCGRCAGELWPDATRPAWADPLPSRPASD
jgi:RNA polymerase-binding transcription factor DksA